MAPRTEARPQTAAPGMPLRDDELLIVRTFDAPLALVYRLWEDAAHRAHWWAPRGHRCSHFSHEFREGGAWRACFLTDSGEENWQGGLYQEIEPERRITFTFTWDSGPAGGVETLITITLAEADGQTVQTFHQTPFANTERRDSHLTGWSGLLDRLQTYIQVEASQPTPGAGKT